MFNCVYHTLRKVCWLVNYNGMISGEGPVGTILLGLIYRKKRSGITALTSAGQSHSRVGGSSSNGS
jgi:hypothetical protein